jgi:D-sedoheptulose 7-phosphate isomerase
MNYLVKLIKKARVIYVCGNGGSATTAEHFTCDLFSKGYNAICLNSNTSIMTMIANDFGYEYTFGKQLITMADSHDLLITISCSGTSPNIIHAQKIANEIGMKTYAFQTFDKDKDYEKLEDEHLRFAHEIKKLL